MMRFHVAAALLCAAMGVQANCNVESAVAVAEQNTHFSDAKYTREVLECRDLPDHRGNSVVVARYYNPTKDSYTNGYEGLDAVLYTTKTGKLVARYSSPSEYQVTPLNPYYLDTMVLDTARYNLSPTQRAFGVRAYLMSTSVRPQYELFDLFAEKGGQLVPVIKGLVASVRTTNTQSRRTLSMGSESSNGYADIIVHDATAPYDEANEAKIGMPGYRPPHYVNTDYTLHFDGAQYPLPGVLTAHP